MNTKLTGISLVLLSLYYVISLASLFGPSLIEQTPLLRVIHEQKTITRFQKDNASKQLMSEALVMHKNDSEILYALASQTSLSREERNVYYQQSLKYDPLNLQYAIEYFKFSFTSEEVSDVYLHLAERTKVFFPHVYNSNPILHAPLSPSYKAITENDILNNIYTPEQLGKFYYFIGLEYLSKDPIITEKLWQIARQMNPWLGFYYTELMSLYTRTLHSGEKARELLSECNKFQSSREECNRSFEHREELPEPGFTKDQVRESE